MNDETSADVAVVGAGIVGLSHAWAAAKRGHRVIVFDRSARAVGASVRNFGMVWPIGQTPGANHETALLSRSLWLDAIAGAGLWHDPAGSITLAIAEDERAVLEEFADAAPGLGYDVSLLTPAQAAARCPAARADAVIAGLYSPTEVCVDPHEAIAKLPAWLNKTYGVSFRFNTTVTTIDMPQLTTADGSTYRADRVFVCSGDDLTTLLPETLAAAGIRKCKLQMMRTVPQPGDWRIGPMIASGLTLRHYPSFELCPSLDALRQRVAEQTPELDHYGIHVMASQHGRRVVIGDTVIIALLILLVGPSAVNRLSAGRRCSVCDHRQGGGRYCCECGSRMSSR